MSKTWTGARRGRRTVAPSRGAVCRRRAVAALLLAAVAGLMVAGASLARDEDAFSGVWWEPSSGRRVEIVRDDQGYTLLYGAERRPFAAEKSGDDELRIAAPLGGDIIVRAAAADRLELVDGGTVTVLRPAPDGS